MDHSAHKLPSISDLINNSIALVRPRILSFAGIQLLPTVVAIIFVAFSVLGGYKAFTGGGTALPMQIVALLGMTIFVVFLVILQLWGQLALLFAIVSEKKLGVKEAFTLSRGKLLSYWWVAFLTGFLVIGGMFFFVIPGILFSVWFSFAMFVLVVEGKRGFTALMYSREYVRGHFWGIALRMFVLNLIFAMVNGVIGFIFGLVDADIVGQIAQVLTSLVTAPLSIAFSYLLYKHLRESHAVSVVTRRAKLVPVIISLLGIVCFIGLMLFVISYLVSSGLGKIKNNNVPTEMAAIQLGLLGYKTANGTYPADLGELTEESNSYIDDMKYIYTPINDGQDYQLCLNQQPIICVSSQTDAETVIQSVKTEIN